MNQPEYQPKKITSINYDIYIMEYSVTKNNDIVE